MTCVVHHIREVGLSVGGVSESFYDADRLSMPPTSSNNHPVKPKLVVASAFGWGPDEEEE